METVHAILCHKRWGETCTVEEPAFLPAAKPAGQWMIFGFFPSRFVKQSTIEAREALEHRLLGPLSSNMKSEVT